MLAYKQAQDNQRCCCPKEALEASKQRLPYACLLSAKGAYYVANKQTQIEAKPFLLVCPFLLVRRKQGKTGFYLCLLISISKHSF
jgi:hypothetical protein